VERLRLDDGLRLDPGLWLGLRRRRTSLAEAEHPRDEARGAKALIEHRRERRGRRSLLGAARERLVERRRRKHTGVEALGRDARGACDEHHGIDASKGHLREIAAGVRALGALQACGAACPEGQDRSDEPSSAEGAERVFRDHSSAPHVFSQISVATSCAVP
jgi:hypothetical protein